MRKNLDKDIAKKFLLDPQWGEFQEWFIGHFENEADIAKIDITLPSTTVHAEVIARQSFRKKVDGINSVIQKLQEKTADTETKRPFK